ncbi:GNAT family N-acetyltransferase [Deinococcus maricopensis]|uniref:GCN5-related N-acetyltransferase n=1 Tax=Deinococcus maricopensis (strain DSM 21211 / LMG 22137 / NRRL B-23946 / LB-34) TaxID=709986 RepID=E8U8W8_DEIML|nr:GNAT family N-acetyltransferase [Deinococcus maricopensis]ADV67507.1 GCN5-related N-acetyltransferase [Deinococcus maricopensis DSM 21211]
MNGVEAVRSRGAKVDAAHLSRYARGGAVGTFGTATAGYVGADLPVNAAVLTGAAVEWPALEAFFEARGTAPVVQVFSGDVAVHAATLAERGYTLSMLLHVHARGLVDLPPAGHDVRELLPAAWSVLAARAFGPGSERVMQVTAAREDTTLFACSVAGEPVGVGALSVFQGVALLFSAGTVPGARGQGVQAALLAARLERARALGAQAAMVLTTPGSGSERNVARAGFTLAAARATFQRR